MTDIIRDIRQQPFYWIDREFLPTYGEQIGATGIAVYNALAFRADRTGRAFPGAADLMKLTGIRSRTTLRRSLSDLERVGLITIKRRNIGKTYESNEYFLLPIAQEMTGGRSLDDRGVGQKMTEVGHPVTGGRSLDDRGVGQKMDTNNNHATTIMNNMHEQQASNNMPLPAAAASLLESYKIKHNGDGLEIAAWLVYAMTQSGLRNPAGYAVTQVRNGQVAGETFREIADLDIAWQRALQYAKYEKQYRFNPNIQGLPNTDMMAELSDEALDILCAIAEVQQ